MREEFKINVEKVCCGVLLVCDCFYSIGVEYLLGIRFYVKYREYRD